MDFISQKLNKSVLDPIHGLIPMTEEETNIISHSLFNRLRRIKQNTFLYYVFPSANHTRFEHSIGVMHLASKMFISAFQNANAALNKRDKYGIEEVDEVLLAEKLSNGLLEQLYYDIRIAALLHDIGHGPMSHLFDKFAPKNKDFLKMILSESENNENLKSILTEFHRVLSENVVNDKLDSHYEHEYVSYLFTIIILKDLNFDDSRIKRILSIMNSKLGMKREIIEVNDNQIDIIPFLNHIVAGAPLDCDRMDYLLRDSYFTGVKYGAYDLNRLMKSLLPFIDLDSKTIKLGIKKSGLPAIENFLQARYEMFVQVYFHKTNRACNTMLTYATENNELIIVSCNSLNNFIDQYKILSDEWFLNYLEKELPDPQKKIISHIKNREIWKRVIETNTIVQKVDQSHGEIESITSSLKNKFNCGNIFIAHDKIQNNPIKDLNNDNTVLLTKNKNELYFIEHEQGWIENSIIFKALSTSYNLERIYIGFENPEKDNKKIYREVKLFALNNVGSLG